MKKTPSIEFKMWLLRMASVKGVSHSCKTLGYSRSTFYKWKRLYEQGGRTALKEVTRKKPIQKNRVSIDIEKDVLSLAYQKPLYGQAKISTELKKLNIEISPSGVRSVLKRNDLETRKKRLKAFRERLKK